MVSAPNLSLCAWPTEGAIPQAPKGTSFAAENLRRPGVF
jgi:hypothetical protein